jgi:hypothetical protein
LDAQITSEIVPGLRSLKSHAQPDGSTRVVGTLRHGPIKLLPVFHGLRLAKDEAGLVALVHTL